MDHNSAVHSQAVERYLLGEMSADERNQFEQHYFECAECARGVMDGNSLAAGLKESFATRLVPRRNPWLWWSPAFAAAALALVVIYQNALTIPKLRASIEPQPLSTTVLRVVRSAAPQVTLAPGQRVFNLVIDVNTPGLSSSLDCEILGPAGARIWRLSAPLTDGSVSLLLPASLFPDGDYILVLQPGNERHPFHVARQQARP